MAALFELSINNYRTSKRYTEYAITIISKHRLFEEDCYTIHRRYSDFQRLHNILEREILYLPEFPEKRFFNKSQDVIEMRKEQFTKYLRYVGSFILRNGYEDCASGRAFIEFISQSK